MIVLYPVKFGTFQQYLKTKLTSIKIYFQNINTSKQIFGNLRYAVPTMTPRKHIINNNSLAHIIFRCHDRNNFLEPECVKKKALLLLARYKQRYGIKIHDFCIMDNHVHIALTAPSADLLGNFMRTVESQLARFINSHFKRDSQALRERYKSLLVIGADYVRNLTKYIYMNRFRVNKLQPQCDYYCSAYWRLRKPHKWIPNATSDEDKDNNLLAKLLDDYDLQRAPKESSTATYIAALIAEALEQIKAEEEFSKYERGHTIGDEHSVNYRSEVINAYRRNTGPPNYSYV
jgi:REP element-mobilizing transposase RayT